ncbi:MAG: nucleotidyltransferase substrate binding protein [Bacteroidota bacterium]|nr:nucleotidyltransferase substrate binding protein [Bacteroidota bacterium]
MNLSEVRWIQRFSSFSKALKQLGKFIAKKELNELEKQGLIKSFEYTYELAWNTIKDFYEDQGESNVQGSRDAIQLAFKRGLISDGNSWMDMLRDRNKTSHVYDEKLADEIAQNIIENYYCKFNELYNKLKSLV